MSAGRSENCKTLHYGNIEGGENKWKKTVIQCCIANPSLAISSGKQANWRCNTSRYWWEEAKWDLKSIWILLAAKGTVEVDLWRRATCSTSHLTSKAEGEEAAPCDDAQRDGRAMRRRWTFSACQQPRLLHFPSAAMHRDALLPSAASERLLLIFFSPPAAVMILVSKATRTLREWEICSKWFLSWKECLFWQFNVAMKVSASHTSNAEPRTVSNCKREESFFWETTALSTGRVEQPIYIRLNKENHLCVQCNSERASNWTHVAHFLFVVWSRLSALKTRNSIATTLIILKNVPCLLW